MIFDPSTSRYMIPEQLYGKTYEMPSYKSIPNQTREIDHTSMVLNLKKEMEKLSQEIKEMKEEIQRLMNILKDKT